MLEMPGGSEIVFESAVIAEFAWNYQQKGKGLPLWPHEAAGEGDLGAVMRTAQMKLEILKFDKICNPFFFGALLSRF